MNDNKQGTWGGARAGAGRPRRTDEVKVITFRCCEPILGYLRTLDNRSEYINSCIEEQMRRDGVWPALRVERVRTIPFFNEVGVACGIPSSIEAQRVTCMIEVPADKCPAGDVFAVLADGESMIGAGIHSGDRLVIDPNDVNPGKNQPALFEVDGAYTIKYLRHLKDGRVVLMPANVKFSPIVINPGMQCRVIGTVYSNLDERDE